MRETATADPRPTAKHQHVVVPVLQWPWRRRRSHLAAVAARRDEFADPAQGLTASERGVGAGDDLRQRRWRPRIGAKLTGEPGGIGVAEIAPAEPHLMRQGGEQRTPNRGDADEAMGFGPI